MRSQKYQDDIACFICDYWYLILIFIGIVIWGIWLMHHLNPGTVGLPLPTPTSTPTSTIEPFESTPVSTIQSPTVETTPTENIPVSTESTLVPTMSQPTIEPTPGKPTFIIAFVPVNWYGSDAEFESEAQKEFDFFVSASGIDEYFQMESYIIGGRNQLNANSDYIVDDLVAYGLTKYPADRYIGITQVDLTLYGDSDVIGWTMGDSSMGVIIEQSVVEVLAHELGHTFGLCDEYSLDAWVAQDAETVGGCPNPLANTCRRSDQMCYGVQTDDGRNSIMGPGGLEGPYGFNTASDEYLQSRFSQMVESVTR